VCHYAWDMEAGCKKHEVCWQLVRDLIEWFSEPDELEWVDDFDENGNVLCVMEAEE
jgi:hypothetical protein